MRALRESKRMQELRQAEAEVGRLSRELETIQKKLKVFDQMLTLCSACKKVRDENNDWRNLEVYLHKRLGLTFSHGICPDCIQKYYTGYT